jgi:3-hydroxyisobutyrate dehydrogenase-like beta-hydroxyacid dehydrogenase
MQAGFIGLGTMGASMAANLQKGGHAIVVNDIRREAAEKHLAEGARWADSPRAVAEACEVVFASLPAPPDVEKVALGDDGILAGMKAGGAFFDLSTNSQSVVKRIHDAFATAFAAPEVAEVMAKQGNLINVSTPEHAAAFFRSELAKYAKIVKAAGIEPQ